jgi:F-type H+-transporting ATPase subunit delta
LLLNPVLKQDRTTVLDSVLKKLDVSSAAANLLRLLADRDRMSELSAVSDEVSRIADEAAGRVRAEVRSAMKLTDKQVEQIAGALKKRLNRDVDVDVEVDSTLLGGMVCQVGDLTFDTSIKRQLELLRERLEAH